ncbi:aconitase X catalytic domain-containing protein [Blastococcus capsensis]|uniref:aconitase X catalytic domain-containing protein n=1 Tax=Blastococcus capsensis TaxID=1564163 RepID=UPI0025403DC0|nr:aconitase X catalytic domain-containing protein [Blastococcus capsensis]MDK3258266.1 aconitase X catalytic domain-containing protein [Blastococcus capsensis]
MAPALPLLTAEEQGMLAGDAGPATALGMRLVVGVARATGAERLVEVASAHGDGCLYHGAAGLEFTERLVEFGGRVRVRTTLNVGSLDLLHPGTVRADAALDTNARRLMDAHVALGCEPTWSCAPYQAGHRPSIGSHVAWAESNAIAFVNSVLGARTDRYGDFLDLAAAITGRVPFAGLHQDEGRRAELVLDLSGVPGELLDHDAAWPAVGALLGDLAGTRVAALVGLPGDLTDGGTTEDRLKALGATAASTGGVALFHVIGVTPEASTLGAVARSGAPVIPVTAADLRAARDRLSTVTEGRLDAVSLGTPHFSVAEFAALASALAGGPAFARSLTVYVSTSRAVLEQARALGYADTVEGAGARIVTDTCTYVTPVLDPGVRTVMTNSGKWAWYAPANLGIDTVLGSLPECVASARAGEVVRDGRLWG